MRILLTNDDGIDADGLRQALDELKKIGDVYVAAPEGERSSVSHHLTISGRIRYEEREVPGAVKAYAIWGTPCDCVDFGLDVMFKNEIDIVVSGINRGPNQSSDIIYSGTVAAAREGYFHGVPSVAISITDFNPESYYVAAKCGSILVKEFYESKNNTDYFLNVNVPNIAYEDIKGYKLCTNAARIHYNTDLKCVEEDGKHYVEVKTIGRDIDVDENDLSIDINATDNGYVSLSALHNSHISDENSIYIKNIIKKLENY